MDTSAEGIHPDGDLGVGREGAPDARSGRSKNEKVGSVAEYPLDKLQRGLDKGGEGAPSALARVRLTSLEGRFHSQGLPWPCWQAPPSSSSSYSPSLPN